MANNLLQNPITINAAMATPFQASIPSINQRPYLRIRKIQWIGQTTGMTFQIEDGLGNFVWQGDFVSADQTYDFADPITVRDFRVTQLSGGTLLIYLA